VCKNDETNQWEYKVEKKTQDQLGNIFRGQESTKPLFLPHCSYF
jgi:hypothetical protein